MAPEECLAWLRQNSDTMERQGRRAGPGSDENRRLQKLVDLTEEECQKGLIGEPWTEQQLRQKFTRDGRFRCRILPRFLTEPPGGKPRPIDDGKKSKTNAATRTVETVALPTVEFVAKSAAAFARDAQANGRPMAPLVFGSDDAEAAYRRVPTSQPEFTVIAYFNPRTNAMEYRQVFGLPFGLTSAVLQFNRVAHFICWTMNTLFGVVIDHYFDDYLIVDQRVGGQSAQSALAAAHRVMGLLSLAEKKHSPVAKENKALGVWCDVSRAHDRGEVSFRPDDARMDAILDKLRECRDACDGDGCLPPHQAASIHGKLGFTMTALYGNLGRAATQPLIQRMYRDPEGDVGWSQALSKMLAFFTVIFALREVTRRVVQVKQSPGDRPHVVLYTDACYSANFAGLGIVISDPETNERFFAALECPPWARARMTNEEHVINQLETLAAVAALLTFPDILRGRRVLYHIDNHTAISATVHGYSSKVDIAELTNMFHTAAAILELVLWIEYVASDANIADIPSHVGNSVEARHEHWELLNEMGFIEVPMVLPSEEEYDDHTLLRCKLAK